MSTQSNTWSAVDDFIAGALFPDDPVLDSALAASAAAGLPHIQVSPAQGRLLQLFARMQRARAILEIGTLGGYSTIWLARALPADGRLITMEYEPKHADVARENITRAGLAGIVDIRVGPALDALPQIEAERAGPFDLTFIDADKVNTPEYFRWALRLSRPGSVIIADNVVRNGALADLGNTDPGVEASRTLHALVAETPGVTATTIQTVGCKGYDGFTLVYVSEVQK
jgi:predicted O-methyltransferase YrrM